MNFIKWIVYQRFGLFSLYNYILLKYLPTKWGNNLKINGKIARMGTGRVYIGDDVIINSNSMSNPIGGDGETILRAFKGALIYIGSRVGISNSAIVAMEKITIEDDVLIGGSCKIYDNDFHSIEYETRIKMRNGGVIAKPIHIKQGAFVGAHSIILKGVTIGKHSVVGAGSVVTKDIPDGEIWAGNPAIFVRKIE